MGVELTDFHKPQKKNFNLKKIKNGHYHRDY